MANDEQQQELLRLIAALTERVYNLEQAAGLPQTQPRTPSPAPTPISSKAGPPNLFPATPNKEIRQEPQHELESRIGGHWLNRVGIVAVLIGVSYFLKYAFDNEWVGPAGRVVIGLVAGVGVVFWSEYVRRSGYTIFSYSLKAGGIGVLYLSLWASFQVYQLVPNALAFFAMASVTAATVALAIWQDAEVIAAFAAVGGFITPVALSTGENNAVSLFTYIAILDVGALLLSRYRPWVRVLIGSYLGTLILYSSWHSRFYTPDQFSIAFVFVSAVFIVFALAAFFDKHESDSKAIAILALATAATYFYEVWELFHHAGRTRESAIAAVALSVVYFFMARQLTDSAPEVTSQVHWSIGVALLIIAVPIGLDARWITIGWFIEAGALVEISRRTRKEFLKHLAAITLVLGVLRLVAIDKFDVTRLVFNERMTTFAVAIAVLAFVARTVATAGKQDERIAAILTVTINILALLALNQEITDASRGIIRDFAYSALWMSYGAGLMFIGFWKKSRFLRWQALILIGITTCKVFLYDVSTLDHGYRILSFIALGLILLATSFLYQRDWFKLDEQ